MSVERRQVGIGAGQKRARSDRVWRIWRGQQAEQIRLLLEDGVKN